MFLSSSCAAFNPIPLACDSIKIRHEWSNFGSFSVPLEPLVWVVKFVDYRGLFCGYFCCRCSTIFLSRIRDNLIMQEKFKKMKMSWWKNLENFERIWTCIWIIQTCCGCQFKHNLIFGKKSASHIQNFLKIFRSRTQFHQHYHLPSNSKFSVCKTSQQKQNMTAAWRSDLRHKASPRQRTSRVRAYHVTRAHQNGISRYETRSRSSTFWIFFSSFHRSRAEI